MLLPSILFASGIWAGVAADPRPLEVPWNNEKHFGPDGPWRTVKVTIGTGDAPQVVNLYPGGSYASNILTDPVCKTGSVCIAQKADLFEPAKSPTADYMSIAMPAAVSNWNAEVPMNLTGMAMSSMDTVQLESGPAMPYTALSLVAQIDSKLPNGSSYVPPVGSLALGGPDLVQSYPARNGTSSLKANLLTGSLRNSNTIPSSSFGLHIGSVPKGIAPSLVLGGYDQSHIVGNVSAFDMKGNSGQPQLKLIGADIGVDEGGLPFNTTTIPSVFRAPKGKTSVPVVLNPLVPYMVLPSGMCDAITQWFPTVYLPGLGLHSWNRWDFRSCAITDSPAYIRFTFEHTASSNLTIKVPFSLLNMTLEPPLVSSPQTYFPCLSYDPPDGVYHLGRAFLQAAFLGVNWEAKRFFVAQAPGPNLERSAIVPIRPDDAALSPPSATADQAASLAASWQGHTTPVPLDYWSTWGAAANGSRTAGSPGVNASTAAGAGAGDLSLGAKIGIGASCGMGGLAALAFIAFLAARRHRDPHASRPRTRRPPAPCELAGKTLDSDDGDDAFYAHSPDLSPLAAGGAPPWRTTKPPACVHCAPRELHAPRGLHEVDPANALYEAPPRGASRRPTLHEIDSAEVSLPRPPPAAAAASSTPTASARGSRGSAPKLHVTSPDVATLRSAGASAAGGAGRQSPAASLASEGSRAASEGARAASERRASGGWPGGGTVSTLGPGAAGRPGSTTVSPMDGTMPWSSAAAAPISPNSPISPWDEGRQATMRKFF